jgi:putative transposase
MGNHYHLLLETVEGNLSQGMRQLNGAYTQNFNRRHGVVGHLLQGRYKAILVQKESYLLELARYVVLNPVRAGMVESPRDWKWSNYRANLGYVDPPPWLATEATLAYFGAPAEGAVNHYRRFVHDGIGAESPLRCVEHQFLLGDEDFVRQYGDACSGDQLGWVTKAQRKASARSLSEYQALYSNRDEAMARAYWTTAFTMAEIGKHFGVGYSTVSRAVARLTSQVYASQD